MVDVGDLAQKLFFSVGEGCREMSDLLLFPIRVLRDSLLEGRRRYH